MFTIFDRYLLKRYVHVFFITFTALFGLFVIIDAFTNVDEFLERHTDTVAMLSHMLRFYSYRGCQFFLMIGAPVTVISAVVVFSLVQRHGELNPVLSAGIPTYRLVVPIIWGTIFVEGLMLVDQELIIPNISSQLQLSAGNVKGVIQDVELATDFSSKIAVTGGKMHLPQRKLEQASFILPVPSLVDVLHTVRAPEAIYYPKTDTRPSGWLLTNPIPKLSELPLTEEGKKLVRPTVRPDQMYIVTDVSFDRLYHGEKNFELLSTAELMRRVKNPSFAETSIRRQSLYLHTRFANPLIDILVVMLTIPFVARRESRALLMNMAMCGGAMTGVFATREAFRYFGGIGLIAPDLAAWAPVVITGTASAWFSAWVRT